MSKHNQTWVDDDGDGEGWIVSYYYDGAFYPGNQEEPPEYPELVIDSIIHKDTGREFGEPTTEIEDYINQNHTEGDDYECYHGED